LRLVLDPAQPDEYGWGTCDQGHDNEDSLLSEL